MLPTMFIKMCAKSKHIHLTSYVEVEKCTLKVNAALLSNSLDLRIGKMCEPCNSFLAKVRESQGAWYPKSQGEPGNFAKKKLGWNPERVSHNFAEITVVESCSLRVNWQI